MDIRYNDTTNSFWVLPKTWRTGHMIIIQNWAHDNNSRDFGVITLCSDESTDVMRLNFAQLQSFPPRKKKEIS
jgi:hypothetical protein